MKDRFEKFTENEKTALLEGLEHRKLWYAMIIKEDEKEEFIEIFDNLINEVSKSLDEQEEIEKHLEVD